MNKQATLKATSNTLSPSQNSTLTTGSHSTSSTSSPQVIATPASTTSLDPDPDLADTSLDHADSVMDKEESQSSGGTVEGSQTTTADISTPALNDASLTKEKDHNMESQSTVKTKKTKQKAKLAAKKSKSKRKAKAESSDSGSSSIDSESEDADSESSEDEKATKKKKAKAHSKVRSRKLKKKEKVKKEQAKLKMKAKKKKSRKADFDSSGDSDSSESESESESEDEKKKRKAKAKGKAKKRKSKKKDSSSESSSDSSSSSSSSESSSESEDDKEKRKKKAKAKAKAKAKKSRKQDSSSDDSSSHSSSSSSSSSSDSDSDSEDEKKKKKSHKKKGKKCRKAKKKVADSSSSNSSSEEEEKKESTETSTQKTEAEELQAIVAKMQEDMGALQLLQQQNQVAAAVAVTTTEEASTTKTAEKKKGALEYKRVDQTYDSKTYAWKLTETGKESIDDWDCVFNVRRKFTWDNKFLYTTLDIKSRPLRDVLQIILKGLKGISLVEDTPTVHPHMIYLYYDELKTHTKKLKLKLKKAKKSKEKKKLKEQISHCKLLAEYVDQDYGESRKKIHSLLKAGQITYDLLWAIYKPNTIAYTPTYGNKDDPRCFKVDMTYLEEDFMGNEKMVIEGRYLEYDGKIFGLGDHAVRIASFKGPKKIVNLEAYPLKYHKNPEGVKKQLIERGKKFVALQGMNYRALKGIAYMKQKRGVARSSVNGRVMVDPAIFRRLFPNYQLSYIKQDEVGPDDSDSESDDCCDEDQDSDDEEPTKLIVWRDKKGRKNLIHVPVRANMDEPTEKLESVASEEEKPHTFTEEELLIASPVVLGFSFSEKNWFEFSLQGIADIEWNKEAFESLVLADHHKQHLKGLVSSHRFNAAKTIDDVIRGKGKGVIFVLHGPPGVGKTLTAESIAEYLRAPLYAVSAGELGTSSQILERDLNRIMDVTHSWGAILLIDEADVFMEARQAQDVHRNSLVSVFLRLLEYYQGILFLTTNRVETFDEAFQSRIHMGIKYSELTAKARIEIWKHHISKVVDMPGQESVPFKDSDIEELSHKVLNGRQIKNDVKTAQSIALAEKEPFSIKHLKQVMEVQEEFQADMRGGPSTLAHYA